MRIAQITNLQESVPPLNKNGLEQVVHYLTEELVRQGHEVTLFGTADSKTSAKLVPVWPMAVTRDDTLPIKNPLDYSVWSVAQAFGHYREFDIIHDHTWNVAGFFAGVISTPVVTTLHHPAEFEESILNRFSFEHRPYLDNIWAKFENVTSVVVSKFQQTKFKRRTEVIYNGLPVNEWKFQPGPGEYFAFLGYVTKNKGVAEAIQAVLPTGQRLKIAGPINTHDAEAQKYFETQVKPYLGENIEYVGPLNHDQKMQFLGRASATLMPIQWDEPFGMVAIESMACGTPVVAWDRAAMPEIIEPGKSGFLVRSVEELTDRLGEIASIDRGVVRKRVEEHFSAEKMAKQYVKLYEQILLRRG